jgi:hypothetical protein
LKKQYWATSLTGVVDDLLLGEREQCRGNFDPRARLHAFEVFAR